MTTRKLFLTSLKNSWHLASQFATDNPRSVRSGMDTDVMVGGKAYHWNEWSFKAPVDYDCVVSDITISLEACFNHASRPNIKIKASTDGKTYHVTVSYAGPSTGSELRNVVEPMIKPFFPSYRFFTIF